MSDRSWFLAFDGQQHGPYPEAQLRQFIAEGRIAADTPVWTDGMADWQNAGDIPGLFARAAGPPGLPRSGGPPAATGGYAPIPWLLRWYTVWYVSQFELVERTA